MDTETKLADDTYSRSLSRLLDNPAASRTKGSTIQVVTLLGHTESWIVQTIRVENGDTVFVQRINAEGGMRLVLPSQVAAAIARQRDTLNGMSRRKGARQAVETRKAKRAKG